MENNDLVLMSVIDLNMDVFCGDGCGDVLYSYDYTFGVVVKIDF